MANLFLPLFPPQGVHPDEEAARQLERYSKQFYYASFIPKEAITADDFLHIGQRLAMICDRFFKGSITSLMCVKPTLEAPFNTEGMSGSYFLKCFQRTEELTLFVHPTDGEGPYKFSFATLERTADGLFVYVQEAGEKVGVASRPLIPHIQIDQTADLYIKERFRIELGVETYNRLRGIG